MKIIINTSLMVPIYEQIVDQIKMLIRNGELKENDNLPSVRTLSKELKISALTVKKAYDNLEREGFTVTVHGKGTYVAATNTELLLEEQKKELEADLEQAIQKGRRCGISDEDIKRQAFEAEWKQINERWVKAQNEKELQVQKELLSQKDEQIINQQEQLSQKDEQIINQQEKIVSLVKLLKSLGKTPLEIKEATGLTTDEIEKM